MICPVFLVFTLLHVSSFCAAIRVMRPRQDTVDPSGALPRTWYPAAQRPSPRPMAAATAAVEVVGDAPVDDAGAPGRRRSLGKEKDLGGAGEEGVILSREYAFLAARSSLAGEHIVFVAVIHRAATEDGPFSTSPETTPVPTATNEPLEAPTRSLVDQRADFLQRRSPSIDKNFLHKRNPAFVQHRSEKSGTLCYQSPDPFPLKYPLYPSRDTIQRHNRRHGDCISTTSPIPQPLRTPKHFLKCGARIIFHHIQVELVGGQDNGVQSVDLSAARTASRVAMAPTTRPGSGIVGGLHIPMATRGTLRTPSRNFW